MVLKVERIEQPIKIVVLFATYLCTYLPPSMWRMICRHPLTAFSILWFYTMGDTTNVARTMPCLPPSRLGMVNTQPKKMVMTGGANDIVLPHNKSMGSPTENAGEPHLVLENLIEEVSPLWLVLAHPMVCFFSVPKSGIQHGH